MSGPKLSKACGRDGASMGRRSGHALDKSLPFKFRLYRIPINSGGYDSGGAYWGTGAPL